SNDPSIAISGSTVHVVWCDFRDSKKEIYYKRSTDGGANWGNDIALTPDDDETSNYPCVAVSGDTVYVVWQDYLDNCEVYYRRSADAGSNWEISERLTYAEASSIYPSVSVSDSKIHVVWTDNRDGNFEIYYKHSGEIQPDNLIKNPDESGYTGDDVYNEDGTDQTSEQTVDPGDTACYHVRIENDGDVFDTVAVTGTGSVEGWTVTYYDALEGGTDITADVTGSGWAIDSLCPGDFTEIRVEVIPDAGLPADSVCEVLVTSISERDTSRLDAVKATTTTQGGYQPDNQIKNHIDVTYTGDDVYNTDGANQTISQTILDGDTAIYHVKIENDGSVSDTFTVIGTASSASWDVYYYDALTGGTDITAQVTLPNVGWSTGELNPGDFIEIRMEVTPVSASDGSTYDVLVVSASDIADTCTDAVKAGTTVEGGTVEETETLVYSIDVSTLSSCKVGVYFTLPQANNVTLSLFDAAGRAVETLNLGMTEAGSHTADIGDAALSKGVYFVKLEAGEKVLTRKLVLTR
ncbi:T9SS type A sorting domain-containing protein, partial [candidate division WOR-3 bacterium]|nr:T9SS type A sorting domain-containing protein [candidate division WOR-3 bacterium]MBD3364577.1 T9SS type A sorting domain-containing protein [candidate division WOR-3 bacterium]